MSDGINDCSGDEYRYKSEKKVEMSDGSKEPDYIGMSRRFWEEWRNSKCPNYAFMAIWLKKHRAEFAESPAPPVRPLCRCPEGVCLLHPNSTGYDKECSFRQAAPPVREPAERTTAEEDRHFICEIGRIFWGDDKECYAASAVYRKVKKLHDESAEVERLREALRKYGTHRYHQCLYMLVENVWRPRVEVTECECGLADALKES